jgi:hypothetical protein
MSAYLDSRDGLKFVTEGGRMPRRIGTDFMKVNVPPLDLEDATDPHPTAFVLFLNSNERARSREGQDHRGRGV